MFGVLEVILRQIRSPVRASVASQGQIAFIVSSEVLRVSRLGAEEPGRFISLGGSGSLRHSVGHNPRIWAWLCRRFKFRNVFHSVRLPLRRKPGDVHSRNCRFGRRGEGGDQALIGAGSWVRHSIKNTESWPNRSRSTSLHRKAKWRFQVAVGRLAGVYSSVPRRIMEATVK